MHVHTCILTYVIENLVLNLMSISEERKVVFLNLACLILHDFQFHSFSSKCNLMFCFACIDFIVFMYHNFFIHQLLLDIKVGSISWPI